MLFSDFGVSLGVHFEVQMVIFFRNSLFFLVLVPEGVRDPILLQKHCVLRGFEIATMHFNMCF